MRVSLSVPTTQRDKRLCKTSAACANFIHQKDAYIAMKVIQRMLEIRAPALSSSNQKETCSFMLPVVDLKRFTFHRSGKGVWEVTLRTQKL